jgi:pimeloyl-ACP methyl ester carboxylesterase
VPSPSPSSRTTKLRRSLRAARAGAELTAIRAQLQVLQAVAPAAAGRKAVDLWCTYPRGGRSRDFRPGPGAVMRLPAQRQGDVVVESWGEGPAVYLVHGWGGWRGQLGAFVAPLVAAGYRAVAFDAPGHGDARPGFMGPGRGTLMELMEALEVVGRELGPAAGVVAHSLGTTSAAHVVHEGFTAKKLVLVAPNGSFVDLVGRFADVLRLHERTTNDLRDAVEGFTGHRLADYDIAPLGVQGGMPDTLVVHDRHDREVDHAEGAAIAEAWPNARLVSTDGLGHQRILADPGVVAAAVAHLTGSSPGA